jgi:hypothetical protein
MHDVAYPAVAPPLGLLYPGSDYFDDVRHFVERSHLRAGDLVPLRDGGWQNAGLLSLANGVAPVVDA